MTGWLPASRKARTRNAYVGATLGYHTGKRLAGGESPARRKLPTGCVKLSQGGSADGYATGTNVLQSAIAVR